MKREQRIMMKKERVAILAGALDVMQDIAHAETYRQLTEVIETQASIIERVQENENKVCDLEDGVENTQRALLEIRSEILEDMEAMMTARENCPEQDRKIAQLEGQVHTLTEKVQGLIEILSSVCNLE